MRTAAKGKPKKTETKVEAVEILSPSQVTPLIFISHDSRDAELAEAFSRLLSSVSAGVLKSFRSSDKRGTQGIEYGVEWYPELMSKLNSASDVVCLLTQRSIDRPWILYEAGVAKGRLDTPVYGIALGIPLSSVANAGPFAQFQNSDDKEDSLTKLVMQLVRRIPNAEPDRDAVGMQVGTFKEKITEILGRLDADKDKENEDSVDETSVAKLFEEVKVMFQDLPSRVENRLDPHRKRKFRRLHPMMFEDALHMSLKLGDPIGLLIVFSFFRDEVPWLYELGLEAYRTIKSGNRVKIEKAIKNIQMAVDFARHGPFMEEIRDKETYFVIRELPMMIERFLPEVVEVSPKTKKAEKEESHDL
jgi:hypothetical protein